MQKLTNLGVKALLFIVVLVVGSCKDDSAPIICYITTLNQDVGILSLTTYTYNSANKLITVTSTVGSSSETSTYTYDSKNNVVSAVHTSSGGSSSTETFTYDADNRLTGSVRNGSLVETYAYVYSSSGQLTSTGYSYPGMSTILTRSFSNTTTRNYYSETYATTAGGTTYTGTTTYEYDDKINPRRFLEQPSLVTDNNVTKMTILYDGYADVITYSYVYNDLGYPTTKTVAFDDGGSYVETATYMCK